MNYGQNGRIIIREIPEGPWEFLKYLEYFWHNFGTRNAKISIKGSKNAYSGLKSKNSANQNIRVWDRMMTSKN